MHRIHVSRGGNIAEHDLVRADTYDWSVGVEEFLDPFALAETEDVGGEPEVRDGIVPRSGYRTERGEEEVVGGAEEEDGEGGGERDEGGVVGEPEGGELCRGEHGGGRWGEKVRRTNMAAGIYTGGG